MKRISLWVLAFLLVFVVVSAQAQEPRGPNFQGTLHVQSNFEGGGPTINVENANAGGDVAVDFLSAGEFMGNVGLIRETANPPDRFFVLQNNPFGLPLTLSEEGQGAVGIGTPNPSAPFHVRGNSGEGPIVNIENGNAAGVVAVDFLSAGGLIGNVGVIRAEPPDPDRFFVLQNNPFGLPLTLAENGGNVGIGVANPSNILTVQQNSATDPIADAWTTYSSLRWKTNIQPFTGALEKIQRLRTVYFDWKRSGKHDFGLVAEEVGQVVPEIVGYEPDGKGANSVDYGRLAALLLEAIKEQQRQIEELTALVKQLSDQAAQLQVGSQQ